MSPLNKLALALTVALTFLGLAPAAAAQGGWAEDEDVRGRLIYTWPATANQGYLPLWVELENRGDRERSIEILILSDEWQSGRQARQNVALAPGQKQTLEMYVPGFLTGNGWSSSYYASMRVQGSQRQQLGSIAEGQHNAGHMFLLFVSPDKPQQGQVEKWSGQIVNGSPGLPWTQHTFSGSLEVEASHTLSTRLPSQFVGYTSLDAVVVDTAEGLPDDEDLLPMLAYARAGGRVVFLGEDAQSDLEGLEVAAGWLEDRFKLEDDQYGRSYSFGMGALYFGQSPGELMQTASQIYLVRRALAPTPSDLMLDPVPSKHERDSSRRATEIPGIAELPLEIFAAALLIFALIIGPVNFMFLKKSNRPALLLITIPGISILASLMLLAYGVFHQGIDVKMASRSLTLLDQRAHRSTTVEERAIYIGLSKGPLRPEAGTLVLPLRGEDRTFYYRLDFTGGLELSGAFNPVRTPIEQTLVSERQRRVRLSVTRSAEGVEVMNSLPMAIKQLLVRDDQGKWHKHSSVLDSEQHMRLEPIDDAQADSELQGLHRRYSLLNERSLPPSSYLAVVDGGDMRDTCGFELNELTGNHIVIGILPERAEDWE